MNCVWRFVSPLRSTMRKLTYSALRSTMEFGARHLHRYWRQTSFQKDNAIPSLERLLDGHRTGERCPHESATS